MNSGRRVLLGAVTAAVLAAVTIGVGVAQADNSDPAKPPTESAQDNITSFPEEAPSSGLAETYVDPSVPSGVTPDGRSYGPLPMPREQGQVEVAGGDENLPDLLAVEGDNGVFGYIDTHTLREVDGSLVKNPEEAAEYMAKLEREGPPVLPVFDQDGITQIDTFTLQ